MNKTRSMAGLFISVVAWLSGCAHTTVQGNPSQSVLERCEAADDVALRFWYLPPDTNSSPGPLILLPVSSQDPRLDTRPGWSLYVSLSDLHDVVRTLARSHLEWKESSAPEQLVVDPLQLPQLDRHTMEVAISYPNGSATARVKTDRICPLLSDVYSALVSPKARESMALWTGNVDCVMKPYQSSSSTPPKQ
jgi:hypothetical protein